MAWDPVPWLIGGDADGGAKHSPEIMRMLAYYILGGQEGVLGKTDLAVRPLPTPGAGYQMLPGAAGILSAWQPLQEYVGRMPVATAFDSGPDTSSSRGRTDLVVANVLDPFSPGSPHDPPADRHNGPYIDSDLVIDVPPGTETFTELGITNWSAIPVARLDIPPSTRTIEASMITDLRVVANPLTGVEPSPEAPESAASKLWTEASRCLSNSQLLASDSSFKRWPVEADWRVPIPAYATGADVFIMFQPAMHGNVWGEARLVIDGSSGVPTHFDDNMQVLSTGGGQRTPIMISGTYPIPASARGRVVNVHVEARQQDDAAPFVLGSMTANDGTYVHAQMNFKQQPSYD